MKLSALLLPLLAIFFSTFVLPSLCHNGEVTNANARVTINGLTTVAKTDTSFVCVTIDWWPEEKCNYGMCPWHKSSALNLDLENPILRNALKAFYGTPLRIRIGGSLQDKVIYKVGQNQHLSCGDFKKVVGKGLLFDFTIGCLDMDRWKELNQLFKESGVVVTFGLNALYGKRMPKKINGTLWEGRWDSSNARDFINHTISNGYNVDSWELGNELSGDGVAANVSVREYSKDLITLKAVINDLYEDKKKPKILAPGGFFDQEWFTKMLILTGRNAVDVVTHHLYDLGPGNSKDLFGNMQDPKILNKSVQTFNEVELTVENYGGENTSAWIGESGGAFNSGGLESGTFVDSFWYLDQLGLASSHNHKAYCRQTLIGGNYALLDTKTFVPNPDYYSALLWHRLMGQRVLHVDNSGSPYLRAYAHCGRDKHTATLLLINLSNSTAFTVSVGMDMNLYPVGAEGSRIFSMKGKRLIYRLTPKDGNLTSNVMLLNGKPLEISSTGDIPEMSPPCPTKASTPINISPSTIIFVKFKNFNAPVCAEEEDINS